MVRPSSTRLKSAASSGEPAARKNFSKCPSISRCLAAEIFIRAKDKPVPVIHHFFLCNKSRCRETAGAAENQVADGHPDQRLDRGRVQSERTQLKGLEALPRVSRAREAMSAEFRAKLAVEGLALKSNRIALLMGRAATLRGIVRARGKHPSMANAPGTTALQKGLQMRTIKSIGSGVLAREVEEYALDTGLLDEERQYLQHIATGVGRVETGDRSEGNADHGHAAEGDGYWKRSKPRLCFWCASAFTLQRGRRKETERGR
jgi:hypothetical protein